VLKTALLCSTIVLFLSLGCERVDSPPTDTPAPQAPGDFILVDQFGYLPLAQKVAVLRSPVLGFDAKLNYVPGEDLQVVEEGTNKTVLSGAPVLWNSGGTDPSSGDRVWWFDFSEVDASGRYFIFDQANQLRSASFSIDPLVYKPVLKHALRAFYYQRAGFAKQQPFAELGWEDSASHLGPLQDSQCRLYSDPSNAATQRDLSGGWYDAGDYNKYTAWHADNILTLLHAYNENPSAWGDDFDLPESGNGISDLLDEILWGLEWQKKMQDATGDGSVLSIQSLDHDSPPSKAEGPSLYGPATTHATLMSAASFAFSAKTFKEHGGEQFSEMAKHLLQRAESAWTWAEQHPKRPFYNNQGDALGVGAGQQETSDEGRAESKRRAAIYLYAATGKPLYHQYLRKHYTQTPLIAWDGYIDSFREREISSMLYYAQLSDTDAEISQHLKHAYKEAMSQQDFRSGLHANTDAYRAQMPISHYTWGSNSSKSQKGSLYMNTVTFDIDGWNSKVAGSAALGYLHYLHGVNPLGIVYLSNMYTLNVKHSVNEFYHAWFSNDSELWDRVGKSRFGPAPGFLVGGANPQYAWDSCCPEECSGRKYNELCYSESLSPPLNQPVQKAYKDFNTSWPLNSWSISENSNTYQSNYLRLLSKFVVQDKQLPASNSSD